MREQTHSAYMQIVKTTAEQVTGVRGQRTTIESVIPVGRYREREARGRAWKAQNYGRGENRRGEERGWGEIAQRHASAIKYLKNTAKIKFCFFFNVKGQSEFLKKKEFQFISLFFTAVHVWPYKSVSRRLSNSSVPRCFCIQQLHSWYQVLSACGAADWAEYPMCSVEKGKMGNGLFKLNLREMEGNNFLVWELSSSRQNKTL